jgi:hypothetical protein
MQLSLSFLLLSVGETETKAATTPETKSPSTTEASVQNSTWCSTSIQHWSIEESRLEELVRSAVQACDKDAKYPAQLWQVYHVGHEAQQPIFEACSSRVRKELGDPRSPWSLGKRSLLVHADTPVKWLRRLGQIVLGLS